MPPDIVEIQELYEHGVRAGQSKRQTALGIAKIFGVSEATIHYWGDANYRKYMLEKNALNHSKKRNPIDYAQHRTQEIRNRQARFERNPELRLYHEVQSAKNEKRSKRHLVHGQPLEKLL